MRAGLVVLLGAALLACSSTARIAHAQGSPLPPAPLPPKQSGVYWHDEWPRFSVAEAIISAAVTARNADLGVHLDGPRSAVIEFEVPILDHGTRDLLRASTPQGRRAYARLGDLGFRTLVFTPYVVDVGIGALVVNRNPDVAAQLALIDFEVFTLAGLTQLLGSRVIGRARPYVQDCPTPEACTGGPYRGFLSGHTMASFTAAGLMCVHHEKLPLFGGGAADTWACVWALSVASLTGLARTAADEHWASDVLLGAGVGWLYGYYLPKLLHFHAAKVIKTADGRRRDVTWFPSFTGTTDAGVLGVMGTF
jgi:membrane-associated phospholipid phosphatase